MEFLTALYPGSHMNLQGISNSANFIIYKHLKIIIVRIQYFPQNLRQRKRNESTRGFDDEMP